MAAVRSALELAERWLLLLLPGAAALFWATGLGEEEEEEEAAAVAAARFEPQQVASTRAVHTAQRLLITHHYENRNAVTFCAGEAGCVLLLLEPHCSFV
jgi:hypothetical protein